MMSSLFKAGVEEYARQCTVQRRRYEDCRQQTRPDQTARGVTETWTIAVREAAQAHNLDHCIEQNTQSCMIDLLELPVDPLGWEGQNSILDETRTSEFEVYQCQDEHLLNSLQTVTNPTGKSSCSVSYGAP